VQFLNAPPVGTAPCALTRAAAGLAERDEVAEAAPWQ
jgi:hypothetical protein